MKLLVASAIDPNALQILQERHDVVTAFGAPEAQLRELVVDREAIIFRSGVEISREVMDAAPDLRWLIRAGSGLDNLDLAYVEKRGVALHRIAGPGAWAVAELAFGLMLTLARRILVADALLRKGRWAKSEMIGRLLAGRTLGVVGLGNIGTRVAKMGLAWDMQVIGCVEHPSLERASNFATLGIELAELNEVLAAGDFVSIHVPLKDSTRNLIDAAAIARMQSGAYLVNLARGGIVDEEALGRDLQTREHLAGAGLDVHVREGEGKISSLAGLDNVVLTPHIGAATVDSQRQIGEEIVRIVEELSQETIAGAIAPPAALQDTGS
jgi:phosphoglycerate dehydrogenase-like enzyme